MKVEILFQEFGNTAKLYTSPIKSKTRFSIGDFQENAGRIDNLPEPTEQNWINSWELTDMVNKIRETFKIMLDESTKEFMSEVAGYYRPIKKDPESKFIVHIIDEKYHVRDETGFTTSETVEQIVHTFEIDAGKCTFTMYNLLKNVSKTNIPNTLFEKVFNQYFFDYSVMSRGQTYPMKGVKNILEDFFLSDKTDYNNRFFPRK